MCFITKACELQPTKKEFSIFSTEKRDISNEALPLITMHLNPAC